MQARARSARNEVLDTGQDHEPNHTHPSFPAHRPPKKTGQGLARRQPRPLLRALALPRLAHADGHQDPLRESGQDRARAQEGARRRGAPRGVAAGARGGALPADGGARLRRRPRRVLPHGRGVLPAAPAARGPDLRRAVDRQVGGRAAARGARQHPQRDADRRALRAAARGGQPAARAAAAVGARRPLR